MKLPAILFSAVLVVAMTANGGDQVVDPKPVPGGLRDVDRFVYEGKLVAALAEVENCEQAYGKKLDTDKPPAEGAMFSFNPVVLDAAAYLGAKIYKAQILARLGEAGKAGAELIGVSSSRGWYGFTGPMYAPVDDLEITTEGYIAEMSGNTNSALEKYLQAKAYGRAALLELAMHEDLRAKTHAEFGSVGNDPASLYALGVCCELEKSSALAYNYYLQAHDAMEAARLQNPRGPLFYFERQKIEDALARLPASASLPHMEERDGRKTYLDAAGHVIGWEKWPGAVYSETVKAKQDEYNRWIGTVNHASVTQFIRFAPQYPRDFIGNSDTKPVVSGPARIGRFPVPLHIEPTGILDLDTLAIGFYKSAVEWAELCARNGLSPDDLSPPMRLGEAATDSDESADRALRWQLRSSNARLVRWGDFLSGVSMKTSSGTVLDAVQESNRYEEFKRQFENAVSAFPFDGGAYSQNGVMPVQFFTSPPDFITAHINPNQLTPVFIEELRSREQGARANIFLARQLSSE